MIRLSVTELETYRYWRASDTGVEDLLARLTERVAPTPQMKAGRAFAKLFEQASDTDDEHHIDFVDGWTFDFIQLRAELDMPPIREIKAEETIETPSGPVMLVGKADGLGGSVRDQKLTERINVENYLDSLQWRAYLTMFRATTFIYDIFACRYDGQRVTIYDYQRVPFYAYPGMRRDVEAAVSELAGIVARYLPGRVS